MPTQVQSRRGTTAQHSTFTGAAGELTVDTDKKTVVVHDGSTAGGAPLLRENGSQNAVTTGTSTAASFIPTSSTAPTNGVYLPAANSVAISTNGSGRLFVDSSGRVLVGTSSSTGIATSIGAQVQVADTNVAIASVSTYANTANGGFLMLGKSRGTSVGSFTVVQNNDQLGTIRFAGADGVTLQNFGASIEAYVDGTPGANDMPGRIVLSTTADGASTPTERMRIDSSGRVGIGSTAPSSELEVRNGVITAGKVSDVLIGRYSDAFPSSGAGYFKISTNNSSGTSGGMTVSTLVGGSLGEAFRVDDNRRLLVGTSTARANFYNTSFAAGLQVESVGSTSRGLALINNSSLDNPSSLILARANGDSVGSNTVVSNGTWIGNITFQGNDGSEFVEAARIDAYVDGTPGANDMPGRLVFSTTADGASSPTERMRINNSGHIKITTNAGTYASTASNYHEITNTVSNEWAIVVRHKDNSQPYGIVVSYPDASPNGTLSNFFQGSDSTTVRFSVRSNGGIANYSANNSNLSDRNAKKDITPAADTWNCIKEWEIVNYRYKDQPDDADLSLGVIAQQVAESCPEVITVFEEAKDDQPEKLGVKEQQMYWMAIKALQEAMSRIETLEAEVAALKAK